MAYADDTSVQPQDYPQLPNPRFNQKEQTGFGARMPVPPVTAMLIRDKYNKGNLALRKETHDYWLARAFLAGEQWLFWDAVRNSLQQLPRDPSRVRVIVNRVWPASRTVVAQLMSRAMTFEVNPGENDDATIRGAHLAASVLKHVQRDHNWEDLREQLLWATWIGGTGILSVDWDPRAGTSLGMDPWGGKIGTGDITETVSTIVEVAVEPGTRDAERSNWWIRAVALPPDQVQAMYNLPYRPEADASAGLSPIQQRLLQGERRETRADLTLVLTYYERPNSLRPEGCIATVVGKNMVDGPHAWYFPFTDRLNMVVVRETKVPARWTGDTVLQAAIPVQAAFNHSWSNIIEHMKLAGNARLMIPEGSVDLMDELTDLPAEIIPYNPAGGGEPKFLSPPAMPNWWVEQPKMLAEELDTILGVHAVSRGEAAGAVQSGLGLSILAEHDQTPVGHMVAEMAHGWSRFASMVLQVYSVMVKEGRTARIRMAGSAPETVKWTGKALQGQTYAEVDIDSVMPRSRSSMLAFARELWDRQIVADPIMFAKIADFPNLDEWVAGIDPDVAKARSENMMLALDEIEVPADFDDHTKHIHEHNIFRKSVRYRALSQEARQVVDMHIQAHATLAAESAAQQLMKAALHPELAAQPNPQEQPVPLSVQQLMAGQGPQPASPAARTGPDFPQPMQPMQPRGERSALGPEG